MYAYPMYRMYSRARPSVIHWTCFSRKSVTFFMAPSAVNFVASRASRPCFSDQDTGGMPVIRGLFRSHLQCRPDRRRHQRGCPVAQEQHLSENRQLGDWHVAIDETIVGRGDSIDRSQIVFDDRNELIHLQFRENGRNFTGIDIHHEVELND